MRASTTGLGLIAIVSLVACSTTTRIISTSDGTDPGADDGTGSDDGTTPGDPANPSNPTAADPKADPSNPANPPGPVLPNIAITDVAVFQGVKVPVVTAGAVTSSSARSAPVVAKRGGVIRVYVKPASGYAAQDVTAELRLVGSDGSKFPVITATQHITTTSTEDDATSVLDLQVPADSMPMGVTFSVSLTGNGGQTLTGSATSDARFPKDGSYQDIGAQLSGKLKVVLVPVKYAADGSNRLPDTSAAMVDSYKTIMMSRYPASDVEVTVRAPYTWSTAISASGTGFNTILSAITQLRQTDKVASDVYYYGAFAPAANFDTYCGSGCVTGLSTVVDDASTSSMRASVGIGYTGYDSNETMAHEVGHAHGREHAPCGGATGVDPSFPYSGALIGVWGYDINAKTFISPTKGHDMMGYCPNEWVSDYTYNALFQRMSVVSTEQDVFVPNQTGASASANANANAPTTYRIAAVEADGSLNWTHDIELSEPLTGGVVKTARFVSSTGAELASLPSHFYHFDHLPGGFLVVPKEATTQWTAVKIDGYTQKLGR